MSDESAGRKEVDTQQPHLAHAEAQSRLIRFSQCDGREPHEHATDDAR